MKDKSPKSGNTTTNANTLKTQRSLYPLLTAENEESSGKHIKSNSCPRPLTEEVEVRHLPSDTVINCNSDHILAYER